MKVITKDENFYDLDKIAGIRLDMTSGQNTLSMELTDGTTRTMELTPKEMHAAVVRALSSDTERCIDDEDCDGCADRICETDPKRCRFWPRHESEYRHDGCYHRNGNPVPMCDKCPRYYKRLQVCECNIYPCAMCEDDMRGASHVGTDI